MLSGWTDVFQVPGKRTTGDKAQTYAITGPNWKGDLPEGVKELKSPTSMVWILGRTYCTGTPEDYKAVHAIQDKYTLVPLSAYGKAYTPPKGKVDPKIDMKTPVREQVNRMDAAAYFKLLAALMKDNPPAKADAPMVAKMAKIGIVPGKDFDIEQARPGRGQGPASASRRRASKRSWPTSRTAGTRRQRLDVHDEDRASTAPTTCSGRSSPPSASAPTGPRMRSIRPPRRTPTASRTAAPTST